MGIGRRWFALTNFSAPIGKVAGKEHLPVHSRTSSDNEQDAVLKISGFLTKSQRISVIIEKTVPICRPRLLAEQRQFEPIIS